MKQKKNKKKERYWRKKINNRLIINRTIRGTGSFLNKKNKKSIRNLKE